MIKRSHDKQKPAQPPQHAPPQQPVQWHVHVYVGSQLGQTRIHRNPLPTTSLPQPPFQPGHSSRQTSKGVLGIYVHMVVANTHTNRRTYMDTCVPFHHSNDGAAARVTVCPSLVESANTKTSHRVSAVAALHTCMLYGPSWGRHGTPRNTSL